MMMTIKTNYTIVPVREKETSAGNSHQYTEEKSISSENIDKIHVKGSGDLWMVAIWEEDDLSFSITFEKGLTQDELVSMIDSIK